MNYLDARCDMAMKRVLNRYPELAMSLLNALLPLPKGGAIVEMEYVKPADMPATPIRKYSLLDVKCKDETGELFWVEVQLAWAHEIRERIKLEGQVAYVGGVTPTATKQTPEKIYSLNLVAGGEGYPQLKGYGHCCNEVYCLKSGELLEGVNLKVVELDRFTPTCETTSEMQRLWMRYLTEVGETGCIARELKEHPTINQAIAELEPGGYTPAQLATYAFYREMRGYQL